MDECDVPTWLTTTEIAPPVRRHLGREDSSIRDWTCRRLVGGGEGLGVWRLSGGALIANTLHPWSTILKGWPPQETDPAPSTWNWPHREMELYRSGLLADLPGGIQAPACYGETERPDGSVWLWLENITDQSEGPWPLDRYTEVARHLGQFNGAYVAGRPLPEDPWLSRHWLSQWVEAAAPAVAELSRAASHPLVRQVYPSQVIEAYTRLWAERHAQYAVLDQLPQTFCHLDAFRRNLFMRQGRDSRDETVLIDWGFARIAGVGEELASLVAASALYTDISVNHAQQLQDMVLVSYTEGLRDAGWHGDPDLVATGYRVATGLRFGVGLLRQLVAILLDERLHSYIEHLIGRPLEEIVANLAAMNGWLVDLVPEA